MTSHFERVQPQAGEGITGMSLQPSNNNPLLRPRGYAGLGVHLLLNCDELVIVARSREGLARVWERLGMPEELDLDRVQGCIVSSANLIASAIEMASNIGEEFTQPGEEGGG